MVAPAVVHDIDHVRCAIGVERHPDSDAVKVAALDPWRFGPFPIAVPDRVIYLEHGLPFVKGVGGVVVDGRFFWIDINPVLFPDNLPGTVVRAGYILKNDRCKMSGQFLKLSIGQQGHAEPVFLILKALYDFGLGQAGMRRRHVSHQFAGYGEVLDRHCEPGLKIPPRPVCEIGDRQCNQWVKPEDPVSGNIFVRVDGCRLYRFEIPGLLPVEFKQHGC